MKATGVTLEIGGEKRSYRFGPPETWSFPGPRRESDARAFRSMAPMKRSRCGVIGRSSALVDKGWIKSLSGGVIEVRFPFKNGQVQVPLQFRTTGTLNPLLEQQRFKVACPKSVK